MTNYTPNTIGESLEQLIERVTFTDPATHRIRAQWEETKRDVQALFEKACAEENPQAEYPSSRGWVGARRIGYHRRDGAARAGRVVSATARRIPWRNHMPRTSARPVPPRA